MKSDSRKRTVRHKSSVPASVQAEDLVATDVNIEVADAAYGAQMLTAAEGLIVQAANPVNDVASDVERIDSTSKAGSTTMDKPKTKAKTNDTTVDVVVLPAQCLMRDAVELKTSLLSRLDAPQAVQLDVSRVERIDAASMQVLLTFAQDRNQRGRAIEWLGMNKVMLDAAITLGLTVMLKLPAMEAAA